MISMKKIAYLLLIGLLLTACKSNPDKEATDNEFADSKSSEDSEPEIGFKVVKGDTLNLRVPDEEDGGEMLLGRIDREGLEQEPFGTWFSENYEAHVMDTLTVEKIDTLLSEVKIKIYLGSWCEDSQREVPALYKILDHLDFDYSKMELIAMTHDKDTPQNFEEDMNIEYIPSIIFYKDGIEMDRIVEYTQITLEKDMETILSGEDYIHAYEE